MAMVKNLDWNTKQRIAKKMTNDQLQYALKDCVLCMYQGVDEGYYADEASVYREELRKRGIAGHF